MIELIPAIDIMDGKCVRLTQGDYGQRRVYRDDPVEVAREMEDNGLRRLHVVDLDGARSRHIVNARTLERISTATNMTIDFGGGIKSEDDLRTALDAGAAMVTLGSIAVTHPDQVTELMGRYGAEHIILGADVRDNRIHIHGWQEEGGLEVLPFIRSYSEKGLNRVLCTDISRDGMLQGPALELYRDILEKTPDIYLIASGGVSQVEDIRELDRIGVPAVVFGKALYEGKITYQELKEFC